MSTGSRIARLPRPLRQPARIARDCVAFAKRDAPQPTYQADGLSTFHSSPFLDDPEWSTLYQEMVVDWFRGRIIDARWRMWILTSIAQSVDRPDTSFVEFGVYRAGCAFMILGTTKLSKIFLFDTYQGVPASSLTSIERGAWFNGGLSDTSPQFVRERLARFGSRAAIVVGDVFDTLETVETGPLSLAHIDLNAAAPTARALDYTYKRLVTGGVMVFDDYGYRGPYVEQRKAIDDFFANLVEQPVALPTGQAIAVKR